MKSLGKWRTGGCTGIAIVFMVLFLSIPPVSAGSQKLSFGLETRVRAGFDYRPNETLHLALWVQDAATAKKLENQM